MPPTSISEVEQRASNRVDISSVRSANNFCPSIGKNQTEQKKNKDNDVERSLLCAGRDTPTTSTEAEASLSKKRSNESMDYSSLKKRSKETFPLSTTTDVVATATTVRKLPIHPTTNNGMSRTDNTLVMAAATPAATTTTAVAVGGITGCGGITKPSATTVAQTINHHLPPPSARGGTKRKQRKGKEQTVLPSDNKSANELARDKIVEGLLQFVASHGHQKGTKAIHEQNAMDAVLSAVCWTAERKDEGRIASLLGLNHSTVRRVRERAQEMQQKGAGKFVPKERKMRKDCVKDDAARCVFEFCHDDLYTMVDKQSKAKYKVKKPCVVVDGEQQQEEEHYEIHRKRLWRVGGIGSNFENSFMESDPYKRFKEKFPNKTIGITRFRECVCKCLKKTPNW